AFNIAQSSFRQLIETPDALEDVEAVNANSDNWNQLAADCRSCLSEHSKDVEIFSWYTVAQLFTAEPISNLAIALLTFEQVVNQHWDSLQPILPEKKRKGESEQEQAKEVAEHRVKPLLQLVGDTAESGLLYMPLQMLPLVGDIDYGSFFAAEKAGSLAELQQKAVGFFSSEQAELNTKIIALGQVHDAMQSLEKAIGEKCIAAGTTGVSFRFAKESIERLINAMQYLVGDQFSRWPLDPEPAESQPEQTNTETGVPAPAVRADSGERLGENLKGGNTPNLQQTAQLDIQPAAQPVAVNANALASRDHALAELQKIADYFQQTEPHSPIYLLLKRAIRWGGMSLPDLLQELVGEQGSVNQRIQQLAGLESADHQAELVPVDTATSMNVHSGVNSPSNVDAATSEVQASSAVSMPLEEPTQSSVTANDNTPSGGLSEIEW
ncbi:ImpA family type VI secretion system protein, partial [Photobacterium sanctipauli]